MAEAKKRPQHPAPVAPRRRGAAPPPPPPPPQANIPPADAPVAEAPGHLRGREDYFKKRHRQTS